MFHRAIDLSFREGTILKLTFADGKVKSFDMSCLFEKYPQLEALRDRKLFLSGKLTGGYGVIWNDELDIEAETVYLEGLTVGEATVPVSIRVGAEIAAARNNVGITQKALAEKTGIDQSDLSKIERGITNPTIGTLERIADALGMQINITFED